MQNIKEIIKNLTLKKKVIIVVIAIIILIIAFIFIYKYYYDDESENIIENETEQNSNEKNKKENEESTEEGENADIENNENLDKNSNEDQNIENESEEKEESKFGKLAKEKTIIVHVVGEVVSPGVVTLEEGSRIIDAINKAGGKTENADLTKINLAYILEDGMQIYVPRISDNIEETGVVRDGPGENVISSAVTEESKKEIKVNINTANLEKLQTLPGVGQAMANKIIEYRNTNGKFSKPEDIKNVSGIGESKYNKLKEYIVVK